MSQSARRFQTTRARSGSARLPDGMRGWFDDLQFPLPAFEVRTGFPGAGMRSSKITESWSQDSDKSYVIFVRPDRDDAVEVAAALAFQLCRIAVGHRDEHGHLFRHLAISIGLRGTQVEGPPGALFTELAAPILKSAGPLPSPEIALTEKPKSTAQTTRLLRVSCTECGYVARVSVNGSTKWGRRTARLMGQ